MIKPVMHARSFRPKHRPYRSKSRKGLPKVLAWSAAGFLLLYIVIFSIISPAYSLTPTSKLNATIPAQPINISWPKEGQAAIGAIGFGTVDTHNSGVAVPTASVIKTVTALSVLQKRPLGLGEAGPTLTISKEDVAIYETYLANHGSVVPVTEGQKLTEYQILEAMLIRSANNLADTLAIWAFGSLENYRAYATTYVEQLGMASTVIGRDASGLDPGSKSTAADLLKLGQTAMKNPVITEIVHKKSAKLPGIGTITSTNTLLGTDGIIGIKTGTDYQNRGSYLFASQYQVVAGQPPLTIIGAVMGSPSSPEAKRDALAMLRSARKGFSERTLFTAGQRIGQYQPAWLSTPVYVTVKKDIKAVDWYAREAKISIDLDTISNGRSAGEDIGVISVNTSNGRRIVAKAVLETAIPQPSLWWRLTHPAALLKL